MVRRVAVFAALCVLATAHEQEDLSSTQEPFIGWTREDLDAKWGTDVRLN